MIMEEGKVNKKKITKYPFVFSGFFVLLILLNPQKVDSGNPDAKRLYDDLLSNYNKLVRPVANVTETVTVHLKLKLSQLIAVVSTIYMSLFVDAIIMLGELYNFYFLEE